MPAGSSHNFRPCDGAKRGSKMNMIAMAGTAEHVHAGRRAILLFEGGEEDKAIVALLESTYHRGDATVSGEPANVVGIGRGADAALAAVAASPGKVGRLILIAPEISEGTDLAAIEPPTLVVLGSDDLTGAPHGRRCADEMPSCYLMLVYAAGRDVAVARPEASAALIEQFLESGETFPVRTSSHMLYP